MNKKKNINNKNNYKKKNRSNPFKTSKNNKIYSIKKN